MTASQTAIVYSKSEKQTQSSISQGGSKSTGDNFTGKALMDKKKDYQEFLCEFFFGAGYYNSNVTVTVSSSLYKQWFRNRKDFFKKFFVQEESGRITYMAQNDQGMFFLFLFLDFCFDYKSIKKLLSILMEYYSNLHLEDSIAHNISHTKILKSDAVFKDACDVIISLQTLSVEESMIATVLKKYSKLIKLDIGRKGDVNVKSFKKRLSALSGPYFWFFVTSLLETIGLFPDIEGYSWKFVKDYPEEPPQQFNSFKIIKYIFAHDDCWAREIFIQSFDEAFYKKVITQSLPSTYEEFLDQEQDLVVEDWFDVMTDSKTLDFFFDYYNIIAPKDTLKRDKKSRGQNREHSSDSDESDSTATQLKQNKTKSSSPDKTKKRKKTTTLIESGKAQKFSKHAAAHLLKDEKKQVEIKKDQGVSSGVCDGCFRTCSQTGSHLQLFNLPSYIVKTTYNKGGELEEEVYYSCLRHLKEEIDYFSEVHEKYDLKPLPKDVLDDISQMGRQQDADRSVGSRKKCGS